MATKSNSGTDGARERSNSGRTKIFKIIVIGDSNVGKTCLTYRFCENKFPAKVEATIGVDFREKLVVLDDDYIKLQLWDTAGQERFRKSMVPHYYRNVHAVIFVYDVTKKSTFESLPLWISECDRHNLSKETPKILVGNKCDREEFIQVPTNLAQKFADAHAMPLFETSAMLDSECDHVVSIFMTIAHKLHSQKSFVLPSGNVRQGSAYILSGGGEVLTQSGGIEYNRNVESGCFCFT